MKHVLVTGGAGYIGSHVCLSLFQAGFTPVTFDNLSQGHRWAVNWGPLVLGDILNKPLLRKTLEKFSPIGVIHLASLINVRDSITFPDRYHQVNTQGTRTLLEALVEENPSLPFIFSSSAAVYGIPTQTPVDETHPPAPLSPYGTSKLLAEEIIDQFSKTYNIPYISLRYFNAAGADPESNLGESHTPETHLIPSALMALLGKKEALPIYGEESAIRDYIHVTDLAEAHTKALTYLLNTPSTNHTLNLGTGKGYSIQEVLIKIETLTSSKIPKQKVKKNPHDPPHLVADAKKACLLLNWQTRYSDLETIIQTAFTWHKK